MKSPKHSEKQRECVLFMQFQASKLLFLFIIFHSNSAFFQFNYLGTWRFCREKLTSPSLRAPHHSTHPKLLCSSSPSPKLSSTVRTPHIDKWTNMGSTTSMVVMSADPPRPSHEIVFCDYNARGYGWAPHRVNAMAFSQPQSLA